MSALIDDQRLWSTNPIVRDMVHALPTSAGQESGLGDQYDAGRPP